MDADIKLNLTAHLRRNYDAIGRKYASYTRCVRLLLKQKEIPADDLCADLLGLPFFKCNQTMAAELKKTNSINEIFILLTTEVCSFWDYDIFQFIISEYDLDDNQEKLQYAQHFESYIRKHKVSEFVTINPQLTKYNAESEDFKKFTLKFDIDIIHCSLAKVNELKEVVASLLNIDPSVLRLLSIQDGCMEVTFLIPTSKADTIFISDWKLVSEQSEELRAKSVLSITCNNSTFNTKERKLTSFAGSKEKVNPLEAATTSNSKSSS